MSMCVCLFIYVSACVLCDRPRHRPPVQSERPPREVRGSVIFDISIESKQFHH